MKPQKAIGILGGTFDPIHHGHLRMGLELHLALQLDKVLIMPTFKPTYRQMPVATAEHRLQMIQHAIKHEPLFIADDREIRREDQSYTIDSLISLRETYKDTPLCLLIGIDAFLGFTTWHRWQEILDFAHLVIAHRPHYTLPESGLLRNLLDKHLNTNIMTLHQQTNGIILLQSITSLEISATVIREQIRNGGNPRYLLPDAVLNFIHQQKIYQS